MRRLAVGLCAALTGFGAAANGPARARAVPAGVLAGDSLHPPFHVGERFDYAAKVNFVGAGSASMIVQDIETVRGHPTYHTVFDVRGGLLFYHVNDHYESWFDTTTLVSLHHTQSVDQNGKHIERVYDFYPERRVYVRNGQENPSVADPLDEGSFIYFMRSIPLVVGKTYEFNRYYHPDRNPVIIKVERREHIRVPAGEFDAIVVRPIIKSRGLFSQGGEAEVWFADDSSRAVLRLRSKLAFGTLTLELKRAEYASAAADRVGARSHP
jgi:hypothetical protein